MGGRRPARAAESPKETGKYSPERSVEGLEPRHAAPAPPVRTNRGEPAEGSLNLSHPHRWRFHVPPAASSPRA